MKRTPPRAVANVGLAVRRPPLRAGDALPPPHLTAFRHSMAIAETHILAAIAQLGVADALGTRKRTAAEVASELGLDADALHRLLRAGATFGATRVHRGGRFSLTRMGRTLRRDDPLSVHDWAAYMGLASTTSAWAGLPDAVSTGRPAFSAVHGTTVWDHFAAHPGEERLFAGAMRELTVNDAANAI